MKLPCSLFLSINLQFYNELTLQNRNHKNDLNTVFFSVLTCPSLYNNNFLSVACPDGFQNGGKCSFSCKIGSELIGQNITTCGKSKDGDFAIWDFKDKHPYCEGTNYSRLAQFAMLSCYF